MGMHNRTSASRCAAADSPGPSAPISTATRAGRASGRHASNGSGGPRSPSTAPPRADVSGVTKAQTTWPVALAAAIASSTDPRRVDGTASAWPPLTRIDLR